KPLPCTGPWRCPSGCPRRRRRWHRWKCEGEIATTCIVVCVENSRACPSKTCLETVLPPAPPSRFLFQFCQPLTGIFTLREALLDLQGLLQGGGGVLGFLPFGLDDAQVVPDHRLLGLDFRRFLQHICRVVEFTAGAMDPAERVLELRDFWF